MAVFTNFSEDALARYVRMFGQGALKSHAPIDGGIENSNYFVTLDRDGVESEYVLTILEGMDFDEAPFFGKLLAHIYHYGLPVPSPRQTLDGMTATIFCGKPTFLFPKLSGHHIDEPAASHCEQIGQFLADAHIAAADVKLERENPYSADWVDDSISSLNARAGDETTATFRSLASLYRELLAEDLPGGFIHGDLFRDNALFEGDELTGVIDFYHACEDSWLQDIAITINDWCRDGAAIDESLKEAFLKGYEGKRELTPRERELLIPMQKTSALRFALTRYLSGDPPRKDPAEMLALNASLAA